MYLIARPKLQAQELINLLSISDIEAQYLPLIDTVINFDSLNEIVQQINNYDGILFTSPTVIDYLSDKLQQINYTGKFCTVGTGSRDRLLKLGFNNIYCPTNGSGVKALLDEKILSDLPLINLAIIGAEKLHPELQKFLNSNKQAYHFINLYRYINLGLIEAEKFTKLISSPKIIGIIITSKLIAKYFDECIRHLNLFKYLEGVKLITIHPHVSEFLKHNNYSNIYETSTAHNYSILNLLRELKE